MRFLYRLSILCAIALCTACRAELSDTARIDLSPTALADAQIVIDSAKNDLQLLVQRPDFQARFRQEYEKNTSLNLADVQQIDTQWQQGKQEQLVQNILSASLSQTLNQFRANKRGYDEIFVTDTHGLVIGMTNRTSDYRQADEAWWTRTYADGEGETYHGAIEYDESAGVNAVLIYVPIIGENGEVIGILKAVLNITAVFEEL